MTTDEGYEWRYEDAYDHRKNDFTDEALRTAVFEYSDSDTGDSNSKTSSDNLTSYGSDSQDSLTMSMPTSPTNTEGNFARTEEQNAETANVQESPALLWGILKPEMSECNSESVQGTGDLNLAEVKEEETSDEKEPKTATTNSWGLLKQEECGDDDTSDRYKPTSEEDYHNSQPEPSNVVGILGGNAPSLDADFTDVKKTTHALEDEEDETVGIGRDEDTQADTEHYEMHSGEENDLLDSTSEKVGEHFAQPSTTLPPESRNVSGSTSRSAFSNNEKDVFDFPGEDSPASPTSESADNVSISSSKENHEPDTGAAKFFLAPTASANQQRSPSPMSVEESYPQDSREDDNDPYASQPDPFAAFLPDDLPPSVAQVFKSMITHFNGRVSYLEQQNAAYYDKCQDLTYANMKLSNDYANLAGTTAVNNENNIHNVEYLSQQNLRQQHAIDTLAEENAQIKSKIFEQDALIWQLRTIARDGENELRTAKSDAQMAMKKAEACQKKATAKDELIKGLMEDIDVLGKRQGMSEKRIRGMELKNCQQAQDDVEELGWGRYLS